MTNYPHKPFTGQTQPNEPKEANGPKEAKERRKKQLEEVWKRRAIITRLVRRMRTRVPKTYGYCWRNRITCKRQGVCHDFPSGVGGIRPASGHVAGLQKRGDRP